MISRYELVASGRGVSVTVFSFPDIALVRDGKAWWLEVGGEPVLWSIPTWDHWFYRRFK